MIENEFKMMLSEAEYEKLLSAFPPDEIICQTNHYYDTKELSLSERRITCRVREIEGEFFLQMKLPTGKEFSRVELEEKLYELPEEISGEKLCSLSGENELPDVKKIGSLFTKRAVKRFSGAEMDIDRSEYFGRTDLELEIEFTDEEKARELMKKVEELIGRSAGENVCVGKIRRFLSEYEKTRH